MSVNMPKEALINSPFPRKRESMSLILLDTRFRGYEVFAINQRFPRSYVLAGMLCGMMLLSVWPLALDAQELSYDGKRWFEVELSVFTNQVPTSQYAEQAVANNLSLQYLPKLQKLQTPIGSLMIDFPEPVVSGVTPQPIISQSETENTTPQADPPVAMGPLYSPAVPGSYKVNDYARDAFIKLAGSAAQFTAINRNLVNSAEHRMLWHEVWRQPIQPRAQTPAIFVYGGEFRGNHAELEGSLRLSDLGGKPTLDVNLWLNSFGAALPAQTTLQTQTTEVEWKVPELPLPVDELKAPPLSPTNVLPVEVLPTEILPVEVLATETLPTNVPTITSVWQMQQTHDLSAGQLYYFDHPAFGLIIQLRPYLLPEQPIAAPEGDF
jgi:hypothetical protein